jgi:alanine dehydrogenase
VIIGVPKEIKTQEHRVGLVPAGARALIEAGAVVIVQTRAGEGSGIPDSAYKAVGAKIGANAAEVWKKADLIIKVKEPLATEFDLIQEEQAIYTYLHLAAAPEAAEALLKRKATGIAYETIQREDGSLPLLKPMSEVAGKMSVQIGATCLQREHGGRGVLLGGVPGVSRGRVTIIGAGVVGTNACKIAVGMGAKVTLIDVNIDRLEYMDDIFGNRITTLKSHSQNIEEAVLATDLLVGAVLIAGAKAPTLVTREMVSKMKKGAVIVDVAVDQGGCVATCRPTTHDNPTYVVDGVVHYCVANMPGAVSHSSTFALTNATLAYAKKFVELGVEEALLRDPVLALGLNTYAGRITHPAVAEALGKPYHTVESMVGRYAKVPSGSEKSQPRPAKARGRMKAALS